MQPTLQGGNIRFLKSLRKFQIRHVGAACECYLPVVRSIFKCVAHEVEKHPFHLFHIDGKNLTRRQHSLLEIASRNVRILRRLINEILDFRKYENGKMQLNLREVDFGKLVEEWIPSFSELARRRRIKLTEQKEHHPEQQCQDYY